jgi:ATP-dependent protease ClpP protease subunit
MPKHAFSAFGSRFSLQNRVPKAVSGSIQARKRPNPLDISGFKELKNLEQSPIDEKIIARWDAGIRSAEASDDSVIEIYETIGEDWWTGGGVTSKKISEQLRSIGKKDVEIRVNSPGGDMFEGISIFNILQQHEKHVTVKVTGLAASAASLIAMAGDEVLMGSGSFLMLHRAWVVAMGNANDMMEVAQWLEPFDMALRDIYADRSGAKADDAMKWLDDETWFSAKQAIDAGLADGEMSDDKTTRDTKASAESKVFNAAREMEWNLCRKGGKTRTQARTLISSLKGMPGAAQPAKQDAGDTAWITEAKRFVASYAKP